MGHLDPAQAAAAKNAAEIQLTLAGPGAGKTSTLAGRLPVKAPIPPAFW